jgi:RNA polymerase sigma-70 factor (ECF subfamily)
VDEGADPAQRLASREAWFRLQKLLDRLAPKKRTAFVLHAIEGHPVAEVAELVGSNVPTVKSRIWFARRELVAAMRRDPFFADLLAQLELVP